MRGQMRRPTTAPTNGRSPKARAAARTVGQTSPQGEHSESFGQMVKSIKIKKTTIPRGSEKSSPTSVTPRSSYQRRQMNAAGSPTNQQNLGASTFLRRNRYAANKGAASGHEDSDDDHLDRESDSGDDITAEEFHNFAAQMRIKEEHESRRKSIAAARKKSIQQQPGRGAKGGFTKSLAGSPQQHSLSHLRPDWERPKTAPVIRVPQPPPPPPKKDDVILKEQGTGKLLKRHSFLTPRTDVGLPKKIYPVSSDGIPHCGKFTPMGGFYCESSLSYEFDVKPSVALPPEHQHRHRHSRHYSRHYSRSPSKVGASRKQSAYNHDDHPLHLHHDEDDEELDDDDEQVLAAALNETHAGYNDYKPCEVYVSIPLSPHELSSVASLQGFLRRLANHIPHEGTKMVIVLRRMWYQRRVVDITMSFSYANCLAEAPPMAETILSIVTEAAMLHKAKRQGSHVVCSANESLCDFWREYCINRIEKEHPERATDSQVFIEHQPFEQELKLNSPTTNLLELSPSVKLGDSDATAHAEEEDSVAQLDREARELDKQERRKKRQHTHHGGSTTGVPTIRRKNPSKQRSPLRNTGGSSSNRSPSSTRSPILNTSYHQEDADVMVASPPPSSTAADRKAGSATRHLNLLFDDPSSV